MRILEHYMDRKKRDARARELKRLGYTVRRSSESNQRMHPQFVEDWPHPLVAAERGFGNTVYQTYFARLHSITATI